MTDRSHADPALFLWRAAYLPEAMWRVYGAGRKATVARWLILMVVGTVFTATVLL